MISFIMNSGSSSVTVIYVTESKVICISKNITSFFTLTMSYSRRYYHLSFMDEKDEAYR